MFGIPSEKPKFSSNGTSIHIERQNVPWKEQKLSTSLTEGAKSEKCMQAATTAQSIKVGPNDGIVPRACAEVLTAIEVSYHYYYYYYYYYYCYCYFQLLIILLAKICMNLRVFVCAYVGVV